MVVYRAGAGACWQDGNSAEAGLVLAGRMAIVVKQDWCLLAGW